MQEKRNLKGRLFRWGLWVLGIVSFCFLALFAVAYLPFAREAKRQVFFVAASNGDVRTIKSFLDSGYSANTWVRPEHPRYMWIYHYLNHDPGYQQCWSVLMAAVESNNVDAAKLLLDRGADVNACDGAGETCLALACANNNKAMVDLLLSRGADPLCTWKDGSQASSTDPAVQASLTAAQQQWIKNGSTGWRHGHHNPDDPEKYAKVQ